MSRNENVDFGDSSTFVFGLWAGETATTADVTIPSGRRDMLWRGDQPFYCEPERQQTQQGALGVHVPTLDYWNRIVVFSEIRGTVADDTMYLDVLFGRTGAGASDYEEIVSESEFGTATNGSGVLVYDNPFPSSFLTDSTYSTDVDDALRYEIRLKPNASEASVDFFVCIILMHGGGASQAVPHRGSIYSALAFQ